MLGDLTAEEEFPIEVGRSSEKNKKHAKVKLHFADVTENLNITIIICIPLRMTLRLLGVQAN